jgi:hypothetical protein
MRVALLVVILALASLGWNWDARAEFNCFETPGEGSRCACIGARLHRDENSDNCKSEAACDKGELGAIICSCKAARPSKAVGLRLRP